MNTRELLKLMAGGGTAERRLEGNREVWRIRESSHAPWLACGAPLRELQRRGFLWTHFPSGSGSAGLNQDGKAYAKQLGLEVEE